MLDSSPIRMFPAMRLRGPGNDVLYSSGGYTAQFQHRQVAKTREILVMPCCAVADLLSATVLEQPTEQRMPRPSSGLRRHWVNTTVLEWIGL